ncbi:MAG TPA: hypothetical protein VLG46_18450 [Anaerolineae bacterium]|nr:hypothetical protein [Anaerolineae bacterium]
MSLELPKTTCTGVFLIETKAHGGKVQVLNNRLLVKEKPPEKDFIVQTAVGKMGE